MTEVAVMDWIGRLLDGSLVEGSVFLVIGLIGALLLSKFIYIEGLKSYYAFLLMEKFDLSAPEAQIYLFLFLGAVAAGALTGAGSATGGGEESAGGAGCWQPKSAAEQASASRDGRMRMENLRKMAMSRSSMTHRPDAVIPQRDRVRPGSAAPHPD